MKKEEKPFLNEDNTANKEAILRSILSTAESAAAGIIASAQEQCTRLLSETEADILKQRDENYKKAVVRAQEIKHRKSMAAGLECKKQELFEKQRLVGAVYQAAQKSLEDMPADEYKRFFAQKLSDAAENGDEVILSQGETRLDAAWLQDVCRQTGKALKLSQSSHSGGGGIILRGAKYDKNLTHAVIIKEAREKTESEIIKKLFE